MEDEAKSEDAKISINNFIIVILKYKKIILSIFTLVTLGTFLFCLVSIIMPSEKSPLPNKYTSTAQILLSDNSNTDSMSSILNSSGLGSLANVVGVSLPTVASNSGLVNYIIYSNYFIDKLIDHCNLESKFNLQNDIEKSRSILKQKFTTFFDEDSGVLSISVTDKDPKFAAEIVNSSVKLLEERFLELNTDTKKITQKNVKDNMNKSFELIKSLEKEITLLDQAVSNVYAYNNTPSIIQDATILKLELDAQKEIYKQLKAQDELLNIEMASEKPMFQILQYGEIKKTKSGPSRSKICIAASIGSLLFSIILVLVLNSIKTIFLDSNLKEQIKKINKKNKGEI